MKLNRKFVVSFIAVFIMLCGWLAVNAASPEFYTSVEDTNNTYYLDANNNNFSFDILIDDPSLISPGFLGILEWDNSVVVIDDVYAAGRRWSVSYNEQLGDFITTFVKSGYTGKEAVVTIEGHVLTSDAVDTTIRINDFQYTDAVNLDPPDKVFYTKKSLNVTLKRIVLTPTPPDYNDNLTPTPDSIVTPTPTPTPSNGGNGGSTGEDDNNGSSNGDNNGSSEGDNNGSSNGDNNGSSNGDNNGSSNGSNNGASNGSNNGSSNGNNGTNNGTTDKTQKPTDKITQAGTGKTVAFIMGTGILASAVFYIKFSKNNY